MQILINGLITGLAVLALGFTAVYLPLRVFYLALGAIYTAVPFGAWALTQAGWPWYLASGVAVGAGIGISLLCEWFNHRRLERQGASSGAHLISSLGIYIILVQLVAIIWGNETKVLRVGLDGVWQVGNVTLTYAQVIAAIVSGLAIGGFSWWLQFSDLGLQFRALADNPREFALRGYNVEKLRLLAFGLAGLMGSVSALLVAYDIGFDPNGGLAAVLLAVVAVIIGGQRSFMGPFGLSGIAKPKIFSWQLQSIESIAGLSIALLVVCGLLCWLLVSSPWGRLLQVMRDDELAAKGLGKNTRLVKVQAFAIACGLAAVAGTIYASYVSYIDPSTAGLDESVLMVCMVLVGGVGNFRGPLVGAFLLLMIPELLRFAMIPDAIAANLRLILYGVLLVVMMHLRPQGIAGDYRVD